MTARPPRPHEERTPVTLRQSSATLDQGPVFAALARELSIELYELRLSSFLNASKLGTLARECEEMADAFDAWSVRTTAELKHLDIARWQDLKARARELGSKVR